MTTRDPKTRAGKPLLSRDDWADAALTAIAEGGLTAVAVDRLAKTLDASRGSFYWHFADREELIHAALERWERQNTTGLIPDLETVTDPARRLATLFREVYEQPVDRVEMVLAAAADEPRVAPVYTRVTHARLEVLRRIFADLGLARHEANARAWLAYAFYIGHHQLDRSPQRPSIRPARLDHIVELLTVAPTPPKQRSAGRPRRTSH
jgi:AcrR family transcriptional regulator